MIKTKNNETFQHKPQDLADVLVDPILRFTSTELICLQMVTRCPLSYEFSLSANQNLLVLIKDEHLQRFRIQLGEHCWFELITIEPDTPLPTDVNLSYDLKIICAESTRSIADWAPDILYPGEQLPTIRIASKLMRLAHGSCRKPHHSTGDGLVRADQLCAAQTPEYRPDLLIMSGDQLYADDVAGPMLNASHQIANKLGLLDEALQGSDLCSASELESDPRCYYQRDELLPATVAGDALRKTFFETKRKPIFTTDSARNHLITLREVIAAYILLWSPKPWSLVSLDSYPNNMGAEHTELYQKELAPIRQFAEGMSAVQRLMAHIPSYMIWDDHDVTDDWNLSAAWESAACGHHFSNRIIGNAMLGYLIFQGIGNQPNTLIDTFGPQLKQFFNNASDTQHQVLIEQLHQHAYWGYEIPVEPGIVVLDTRTQRWRSERHPNRPSGLMDWEQLVELQQTLLNRKQVILVSPAPIFGVKLIEAIQTLFTRIGKPLMVDAENWMAHPGSANVILNIFRHSRTPEQFVVLSGDVHYSFAYDIKLRFRNAGPRIYQITSSGLRNTFPNRLLNILDRLNRWLYASWSPLNWLTKRRLMRIRPRIPKHNPAGRRLVNASGIGWVEFDESGAPIRIAQLNVDGRDHDFIRSREDEHWS